VRLLCVLHEIGSTARKGKLRGKNRKGNRENKPPYSRGLKKKSTNGYETVMIPPMDPVMSRGGIWLIKGKKRSERGASCELCKGEIENPLVGKEWKTKDPECYDGLEERG